MVSSVRGSSSTGGAPSISASSFPPWMITLVLAVLYRVPRAAGSVVIGLPSTPNSRRPWPRSSRNFSVRTQRLRMETVPSAMWKA